MPAFKTEFQKVAFLSLPSVNLPRSWQDLVDSRKEDMKIRGSSTQRQTDEWIPVRNWEETHKTTGQQAPLVWFLTNHTHNSMCPSSHVSWSGQGRAPEIRQCRDHSNGTDCKLESLNLKTKGFFVLFFRWSQYVSLAV